MTLFRLICLSGILLILYGMSRPELKFTLSKKQQENGWYLEYESEEIAKVMHPIYGYLKHVKLTAPELKLSKTSGESMQIIDLGNVDTSPYSNMFIQRDYFPASGSIGYPVQISDFNHNGLIDFSGAYKWVQDYKLANACVVELSSDSNFVLKKVYGDSLTRALPVTDLNNDKLMELNFHRRHKFVQMRSTIQDSFPDSISFSYLMWSGGGGQVSAETLTDLDRDGNMDFLFVGDDTLEPPARKKIYVAEYNEDIDNFEQKYRYYADDWRTYGFSYGDFDDDGFTEFVTGSIHGHVYIFENTGNDSYSMISEDTLSTSNAYLTVSTNDIDNNGKIEFFVGGSSYFNGIGGTRFYWFEADGDNNYRKVRSFLLLGVDPLSWDEIHTFDVNNDGYDDILINYTYTVVILTWNNLTQEFEIFYLSYWNHPVHGVTMYDLNNDGRLDFFISVKENENVPALRTYYYRNEIVTSIEPPEELFPFSFILMQNFPNPFNNTTTIPFSLKMPSIIDLTIFDITGKEVINLIKSETYGPGEHAINWAGIDNIGKEVSSGLYIYVLSNGTQSLSGRMLIIK